MRRAVGLGLGLVLGGVAGMVGACSSGTTGSGLELVDGSVKAGATGATGATGAMGAMGATGAMGAMGATGAKGLPGTSADAAGPAISAITPPYAFQDRTVDITISGSGTSWVAGSAPTVTFANPDIKVGTITVASSASLIVNITIAGAAALGPTDVTVTSGGGVSTFNGAFTIEAPLTVLSSPDGGIPQGGEGNLHVIMNDLTTPFDPDTFTVALSAMGLTDLSAPPNGQFAPTDFACDITVLADILAPVGASDITVTSGEPTTVTSPGVGLVTIVARSPIVLAANTTADGTIQTPSSTEVYQFTPAAAPPDQVEFVQFTVASNEGALNAELVPASGSYNDPADFGFAVRNGQGVNSTAVEYVVVLDSEDPLFGPGPTPADSELTSFEAACTPVTEETETAAANDDKYQTAESFTQALPLLISGVLGYGSVAPASDIDFYAIGTVPAGQSIHAATGGDPNDATIITIYDSTGKQVAQSPGDDNQQDLVFAVTTAGVYYVSVQADGTNFQGLFDTTGVADYGDPNYNTYDLFVALQ